LLTHAVAALTVSWMSAAAASEVMAPLLQDGRLGAGWREVNLPQQKPPVTLYSVATLATDALTPEAARAASGLQLKIDVRSSYGNLVNDLPQVPAPASLSWAWRLQQANPAVDLSRKEGDDLPVKVCLSFDLALDKVPFIERQLVRFARSRSSEPLPAATLCWVWAGKEAKAALIDNPYTRRVRYIVLRQQAEAGEKWFEEKRDVAADFKRAFGDESATVPPVTAVIVAGDADNTQGASLAWLTALRWHP
jgi:hypothetical protein